MRVSIGIAGAGAFADFSLSAFTENPVVSVSGVYDIKMSQSAAIASKFNAQIFNSFADMLRDDKTNLIYIATPPNLHYEQTKQALLAGKHVICEKPAALEPSQAEEVNKLAEKEGLLYVVNLMQRYNPLYCRIKKIISEGILGKFLHGFFENYASDENLGEEHWMWNQKISGGIFIEHAVHFFDMFEGWLGPGKIAAAQKIRRQGYARNYFTRVQSTAYYNNATVNMYHGFDQPGRMDRQEMKLLFEKGDISLYEWVPVKLNLIAIITNNDLKKLEEIFPEAQVKILDEYEGSDKSCRGNFREFMVDKKISLTYGRSENKSLIYKLILKNMMADQIKWLMNKEHKRLITGANGVNSLSMAHEAETRAQIYG